MGRGDGFGRIEGLCFRAGEDEYTFEIEEAMVGRRSKSCVLQIYV